LKPGIPGVTFKDPCNLRSPQQHTGVVHSSNLCTEITLNTNPREIAVCNLGSINLANHVAEKGIDRDRIKKTVTIAMRMLDNVIDINFYTVPEARQSNLRHRPVGLGIMGYQDALYSLRIPFASEEALGFADESMETISFHAISASVDLAAERGSNGPEEREKLLRNQGDRVSKRRFIKLGVIRQNLSLRTWQRKQVP
jgi:ribonucleoside-diphosphate reductase alpha chain